MRQDSYASTLSKQAPVVAGSSHAEDYKSYKIPQLPIRNSSKISKPHKRPPKTHPKILGPLSSHTTLAAHQAAIAASPLLSLPGEIRNIIYAYALTSETKCLLFDTQHGRFDVSRIGAGLLQTCHMVSREAIYLPLVLNTLVFSFSTSSDESETRMLKCLGKVIKLGWQIGLKEGVDIEISSCRETIYSGFRRNISYARSLLEG
jgi:hypothetical protein